MDRPLDALKVSTGWLARRVELRASVASTNLLAEDLAREGAPDGTLVLADRQTAGRGRLGRSFFSPGGKSLYLSVVLRRTGPPEAVHRHIFAAAVAVAETTREVLPSTVEVAIKWPNDVQLDGRKTCGINLPVQIEAGRIRWAILGVGVNVNLVAQDFPIELRETATSLRIASGAALDRVELLEQLLVRLEGAIDLLRCEDWVQVLDRWRNFFRMTGSRARVGGTGQIREISGVVVGVDAEGALLLDTAAGRERILAGDVTLIEETGRGT